LQTIFYPYHAILQLSLQISTILHLKRPTEVLTELFTADSMLATSILDHLSASIHNRLIYDKEDFLDLYFLNTFFNTDSSASPSDFTASDSEEAGTEPRTFATLALAVRSYITTRLYHFQLHRHSLPCYHVAKFLSRKQLYFYQAYFAYCRSLQP
jgi:hypothetical protein